MSARRFPALVKLPLAFLVVGVLAALIVSLFAQASREGPELASDLWRQYRHEQATRRREEAWLLYNDWLRHQARAKIARCLMVQKPDRIVKYLEGIHDAFHWELLTWLRSELSASPSSDHWRSVYEDCAAKLRLVDRQAMDRFGTSPSDLQRLFGAQAEHRMQCLRSLGLFIDGLQR